MDLDRDIWALQVALKDLLGRLESVTPTPHQLAEVSACRRLLDIYLRSQQKEAA